MNIKFISYDGEFPNLCRGTLLLEIDGEVIQFGGIPWSTSEEYKTWKETGMVNGKKCYCGFWVSGGNVWFDNEWNDYVSSGDWQLDDDDLPDWLKPHAQELIDIFNENVVNGCCGGCV